MTLWKKRQKSFSDWRQVKKCVCAMLILFFTVLIDLILRQAARARRDRALGGELGHELPLDERDVRVIPLFDEDVHALEALGRMADRLVPEADRV